MAQEAGLDPGPGHDVPMRLENDEPVYFAKRTAGINAWFGGRLEDTTLIELKVC